MKLFLSSLNSYLKYVLYTFINSRICFWIIYWEHRVILIQNYYIIFFDFRKIYRKFTLYSLNKSTIRKGFFDLPSM